MTWFKKKLIINGGIIFAVLLVTSGLFYLIVSKIGEINAEIITIKSQIGAAQLAITEYSSLKGDSEKADAALKTLHKAIPTHDNLPFFKEDVEKLARARKLSSGFTFGSEVAEDENKLGSISFNISVEGSFNGILSFLKDLENSGYFLEIIQTSFTGTGANASSKIEGRIYFTD